jgi:hypothetical protein
MEERDIFILKSIFNYFLYSKDPNKYIYGLKSIIIKKSNINPNSKNQTSTQIYLFRQDKRKKKPERSSSQMELVDININVFKDEIGAN